ncbi:HD domain-containing protein [Faecalibacter sp. LW9]|uniref:HD domain-containing protein n=1 Tax=Faecalibacter sp. LW9 TaxID=3103144 RepID=UPI002B003CE4|nr:HD domain-containing protein [Faecalibacter sp. LW9]
MKKKFKIINDPVHGIITIPNALIYSIIQHRYFQRLRKISQNGLTELVYPGAKHSRFNHALGCMHLMQKSIEVLKEKGVEISAEEEKGAYVAILLHDLGHGPFSHSLEYSIIDGSHHEEISLQMMEELNREFNGELTLAISIFTGQYPRRFLSQLVSSQLDVDRLDYLKRDSFFTGVVEGNINPERIISMMNVKNNELVIDAKGISSVEKFLMARIFMYNNVYLHKTSFSAENYLIQVLRRAKELTRQGEDLFATSAFKYFLEGKESGRLSKHGLELFAQLDDSDVLSAIKEWQFHQDIILSTLAQAIVERRLPKSEVKIQKNPETKIRKEEERIKKLLGIDDASYFVQQSEIKITPYQTDKHPILIAFKNGNVEEIVDVPQSILREVLKQPIIKYHYHTIKVK